MNALICTGPLWIRDTLYRTRLKTFDRQDSAVATPAAIERLTTLLGRPPRCYRDFAIETARQWAAGTPATIVTGAT
jgi:hypothetical protein